MRLKKLALTIVLALAGIIGSSASTDDWALTINLADGSTVVCDFTKSPEMSFNSGTITLTAQGEQSYTWNFSEVEYWTFGIIEGINDAEESASQITISDNTLSANAKPGTSMVIYSIDGKVVQKQKVSKDGQVKVQLTGLAKGTYVIKIGSSAMKISVK